MSDNLRSNILVEGLLTLPWILLQFTLSPYSGEEMVIDMKTPRVVHRGGQNVYFCCFGCVATFSADPASAWLPADDAASS